MAVVAGIITGNVCLVLARRADAVMTRDAVADNAAVIENGR